MLLEYIVKDLINFSRFNIAIVEAISSFFTISENLFPYRLYLLEIFVIIYTSFYPSVSKWYGPKGPHAFRSTKVEVSI